jgi:hypothetical protein
MCAERPKFVPHPARRDRSEPSTSPFRSRDATARPRLPRPEAGCAPSGPSVCRIWRFAIAASRARPRAARATRARPRAARATRPPLRVPRPAAGCALGGPSVCRIWRVAMTRSPRVGRGHVSGSLARFDRPRPGLSWPAEGCMSGGPPFGVCRIRRAGRDCSEPSTSPCRSYDGDACIPTATRGRSRWRPAARPSRFFMLVAVAAVAARRERPPPP